MDLTPFQRVNLALYRQLRDTKPTWAWYLRKNCRRFLVLGGIGIGGASLVTWLGSPVAGVGLLGLVAGVLIRDLGMIRRFLLFWPVLQVLNWQALEELADQPTTAARNAEADRP